VEFTGEALVGRSGPGRIIAIVVSLLITAAITAIMYVWFKDAALVGGNPQSSMAPASDNAQIIQDLYILVFWLAGAVFVGVMVLTLAFSLMFREKEGAEALQTHGNSKLEILWTFIPVIIVVIMAVPTFNAIVDIESDAPDGALEIIATGHQWWFEFEYPEYGITGANEMHIPVDRAVSITLLSNDVIHSYWVPRLHGKKDMVPGHENHLWFTPSEVGEYLGQCAEFCGLSHANMRFRVFVESESDFEAWATQQASPASAESDDEAIMAGLQQFQQSGCVGCHVVRGVSELPGTIGPDLTHIGSRTTIASGTLPNTPEDMAAWLRNPPSIKPGSLMPNLNLNEEQIQRLVTYMASLQ